MTPRKWAASVALGLGVGILGYAALAWVGLAALSAPIGAVMVGAGVAMHIRDRRRAA